MARNVLVRSCNVFILGFVFLPFIACHHRQSPPSAPAGETIQIGYGQQHPREVTGAVASATARQMEDIRPGRVEEMLAGRFAGVDVVRQANGDYSIHIRGRRSFNGGDQPLIVIDGIPSPLGSNNPLQDLVPRSIARIDVLKDAGSTAAYGVRGANGVILITTKR